MSKRAMILVRVSSDGQRDNYSPESQQEACRQYADELGMVVQKVHTEVASGVREFDERPVLGAVLDAIRHRQTDAVVIHRINRATRAGGVHALVLAHECERNDVELHLVDGAVKGRVDITDTAGKIMLLIAGDQAYEERKSLLEAMARGRRTRVTNYGRPLHGRISKFGYTWVDEHDPMTGKLVRKARAEVCQPEAMIIRRIFADYARGIPLRTIARMLCDEGVPNTLGEAKWFSRNAQEDLN